ncbi:probable serine/threonine-protein kinase PBL7 isoform X2 [Mercurialis annua]|uniref:probable serine/threonine-protein kinase PBL7 isoform X2 n=1 Tax=Mercurialis annua TaxID=3986 RepID=UPI00216107F6|nr:probable serine/threonine-protein kinase PBL7 isoform X2 [Mercurialis annua]
METNTNFGSHTTKHHHSHSQPLSHHQDTTLSSTSILIIVISAFSAIVILAIFVIIVMLRRLKSANNLSGSSKHSSIMSNTNSCRFVAHTTLSFTSSPDVNGGCLYGSNMAQKPVPKYKGVQVFTYKELEAATDKFNEANVIGNGGYGVAYRGVLADGTVSAIKMFRREGKQGERAFRIEANLLSRLHSPYLVELLGYCADQHHRLLIFEFMPNGTLQNNLHHKQCQPLDWGTRLRIALDCARALEFLHEQTIPSVIHRDLKCSNILLDRNFRAKVSDFGFAKMGSEKINGQMSTRVVGTTGYLAPEYASTGKLTTKSDVYSFGVVLLQLLTGRIPLDIKRPSGEHVLVSWRKAYGNGRSGSGGQIFKERFNSGSSNCSHVCPTGSRLPSVDYRCGTIVNPARQEPVFNFHQIPNS